MSLDKILAAIQSPGGQPNAEPGMNPMAMMMAMQQQQMQMAEARIREEREARQIEEQRRREDKAESSKMVLALAGILLPKLFDKPAIDPLMLRMLENNSNKDALKDFLQTSAAMQQQSANMMMQQMQGIMTTTGEFQANMMERQLASMEERLARNAEKDDEEEDSNPFTSILKAALPMILGKAAPVGEAVVNAAAQTAPNPNTPVIPRTAPKPELTPEVAKKVLILQIAAALHLRGANYDEEKIQKFRRKLVATISQTGDVAKAIMTDNQGELLIAFGPAVESDPMLQKWIMTPAAQQFMGETIATIVKPGLLAIMHAIQARRAQQAQQSINIAEKPAAPEVPAQPITTEPPTLGPDDVDDSGE